MSESSKKLTPSFKLFRPSWEAVKLNIVSFLVLALLPVAYFLLVSLLVGGSIALQSSYTPFGATPSVDTSAASGGLAFLLMLVGMVLTIVIAPALYFLQLQSARGHKVEVDDALKIGLSFFWRFLGLAILTGLMIIVGLILFIIPGIIMIRRYFLAPYYLIDQKLGIQEAMKKSADDSKPVSGSVYGVIGVTILLGFVAGFLGFIPVIGVIAGTLLQIAYYCAPALRYEEIRS